MNYRPQKTTNTYTWERGEDEIRSQFLPLAGRVVRSCSGEALRTASSWGCRRGIWRYSQAHRLEFFPFSCLFSAAKWLTFSYCIDWTQTRVFYSYLAFPIHPFPNIHTCTISTPGKILNFAAIDVWPIRQQQRTQTIYNYFKGCGSGRDGNEQCYLQPTVYTRSCEMRYLPYSVHEC